MALRLSETLNKAVSLDVMLAYQLARAERRYRDCYREMVRRTAALAAAWACVGFCHGALNTDRVSLAGLSVNLTDSAFMEGCAAATAFAQLQP